MSVNVEVRHPSIKWGHLQDRIVFKGINAYLEAKSRIEQKCSAISWVETQGPKAKGWSDEEDAAAARVDKNCANLANLEEGSTTVEYAIGAIATAGFAGLLIAVLKSGGVKSLIDNIIQTALSI